MKDYFNNHPNRNAVKMEAVSVPRVQGSAIELANKRWGYEIKISVGQMEPIYLGNKEDTDYETKEEAITVMKDLALDILTTMCKELDIPMQGFYDLTKNELIKEVHEPGLKLV